MVNLSVSGNRDQRCGRSLKNNKTAVPFFRSQVPVVAQSEFECQIRQPLIGALNKKAESFLHDAAVLVPKRHAKRVRRSREKGGDSRKAKRAVADADVCHLETGGIHRRIERMVPAEATEDIADGDGRIRTP